MTTNVYINSNFCDKSLHLVSLHQRDGQTDRRTGCNSYRPDTRVGRSARRRTAWCMASPYSSEDSGA